MTTKKKEPHEPFALKKNGYHMKVDKAEKLIKEDGLTVVEAFCLVFGHHPRTWNKWKDFALEDYEAGYRATKLMNVVNRLLNADIKAKKRFIAKAQNIALDEKNPNVDMLKFLLERRYGMTKSSKKDVEVSTKDDLSFNVNIVDSNEKRD